MRNLKFSVSGKFSGKTKNSKAFLLASLALLLGLAAAMIFIGAPQKATAAAPQVVVLAWGDQGMHFYNRDYSDLAIAPPYNTIWAQVIDYGGISPRIITSGITVEYSFPKNTYSVNSPKGKADKTNFWQYAGQLFGKAPAPNVGLTGKGLSGRMDLSGDRFVAAGIPLTDYDDNGVKKNLLKWKRNPYQLATIIVRDAGSGAILGQTQAVSAVSSEMGCTSSQCHGSFGSVLSRHDANEGTSLLNSRPVLCANCHASNAPGVNSAGQQGIPSLSNAVHNRHAGLVSQDTNGCYNCHPGPITKGLRDVMSTNFGFQCTTCHGTMAEIAQKANPWVDEPRCDSASCHGAAYAMSQPSYNDAKSTHGGANLIYCAGCHDSAHAIAPSSQKNDNLKFKKLKSGNGPVGAGSNCLVCHSGEGSEGNSCNTCHGDRPRLTPHTAPASMEGGGGGGD